MLSCSLCIKKMVFKNIFYFLLILTVSGGESVKPKPGYILTTSPTIILGSTHKACLTLHHVTGKAHVQISLKEGTTEKKIIAEKSLDLDDVNSEGISCLELEIPSDLANTVSKAVLELKLRFDSLPEYQVDETKEMQISRWTDQQLTFIESDLQVYKPNDIVRIRILTLTTTDFKPVLDPIKKITIENPSGIRIAQWLNVSTNNGLGQIEFPLSPEPKAGVWRIVVDKFGVESQSSDTFEVREYVLPRFKVTIEGPSDFVAEDNDIVYKICGKYSYGKPVQGKVQVTTEIYDNYNYYGTPNRVTTSEWISTDKSGCTSYIHENAEDISKIILKGSLQEEGTEKTENSTLEVEKRQRKNVLLELINVDEFVKPGIVYTKEVKATREPGKKPVPNEIITVCYKSCKDYTTDEQGVATFQYILEEAPVPPKNLDSEYQYHKSLTAQIKNMEEHSFAEQYLKPWYSPSGTYLNILRPIGKENDHLLCGQKYTFTLEYVTSSYIPEDLFFIVQSRSEIVQHSRIRNDVANVQHNKYNLDNVLLSSNTTNSTQIQIPKLTIDLEVTPKMAPKSSLLVYYVTDEGETVSASVKFEVEKCFTNEVEQSWSVTKPYPGQTVNLRLQTAPNSLCAISSVDESTQYLKLSPGNEHQDGTRITTDRVYKSLEGKGIIGVNSNNGDSGYCNKKLEAEASAVTEMDDYGHTIENFDVDALAAFDNTGLLVLSDFKLETHNCFKQRYYLVLEEALVDIRYDSDRIFAEDGAPTETVRDNFPDSWLWELIDIGTDGKLDIPRKLPDTITNWVTSTYCISPEKGLGVTSTPTSHLTAFQPFFVEFSPPYSVKRGEIVHQNVQVFNYMPDSLPVSVSLESVDGLTVTLKDGKNKKSVCIPSEEAAIIPISLTAQKLGKLNVTITAAVDLEYPEKCGPEKLVHRSDKLIKPVLVQSEGFPVEISKSILMCPEDFPKDATISWNFSLPEDVVADSARAQVSVSSDLLGQALENLDQLVQLPMGCGEQNMILFVPNLHVLNYLKSADISKPKLHEEAIKNLKIGYERELNYRHDDGSYSAFGSSDSEGSTWLTAFVLKSFSQAKQFIFIDDQYLQFSQDWLTKSQHENGCFPNIGQVVHKEMQGGLTNSSVGLTAFILIALLSSPLPIDDFVTRNAKLCISRDTSELDAYTLSLVTYAYTLLDKESDDAKNSLEKLLQKVHTDDGIYWWGTEENSPSVKIETTSYAVLSLLKHAGSENMAKALGAVRWLSKHRNPRGGFESTQDTVLALEALSLYAEVINSRPTNLQLAINSGESPKTIRLNKETSAVLQTLPIDNLPSVINIQGTGEGCGMVQGTLRYNVHKPKGSDAFEIEAEVINEKLKKIKICAWYKLPDGVSNMAVIEVDMVTGYEPDHSSLVDLQSEKVIKRFDTPRGKIVLYFDHLQAEHTCVKIGLTKTGATVENAKPAKVKVYDYYSPELKISTSYSISSNDV